MIKKILVPTDFSKQALYALQVAAQLAKRHQAEIYLLHLLELPEVTIDGPLESQHSELPEALFFMKLAHQRFESIMNADFLNGIPVYETAEFDGAFDGIMEYVNKYAIDLIVMGSHGTSGIEELFIGSNTEKVVRYSKVPVLVIKQECATFKIKKLVFATDLQDDNIPAIQKAIRLAEIEQSTLQLVFINTPNDFKTSEEIHTLYKTIKKRLNQNPDFLIYNDINVERGILNFAKSAQADLIGLGAHGRKGLAHFFNGSLSEDLVNHAKRPVITFKI